MESLKVKDFMKVVNSETKITMIALHFNREKLTTEVEDLFRGKIKDIKDNTIFNLVVEYLDYIDMGGLSYWHMAVKGTNI